MKSVLQAPRQLLSALAAISMPPSDLDHVAEVLEHDPAALSLADLGLDSLGSLEMCIALELDHGVLITPETLGGLRDAGQLLRRIATAPRV
jgi:acyl carrier protein